MQRRRDGFDAPPLDRTRWNEIVREDEENYVVESGGLTVTTVGGDIYQGRNRPGPATLLQSADHAGADYVLDTKLSGTIDGGYAQGGFLVYTDDGQYVSSTPSPTRATRASTASVRSQVATWCRSRSRRPKCLSARRHLAAPDEDGRDRTAASTPSTAPLGRRSRQPVTNPQASPRFGLFTLGVNKPGGTITFDYLKVDGQLGCEEPPPTNTPPVIASASASPTSGFGPLQVDFDVEATDADGDTLTYSWDFDGDGTGDSTAEDPSHTYTEAGVYEAEVTVSDGEAERSQTVTVTVLAGDDPNARFRVLVFSKTTGFRHDSIDEGIAAIGRWAARTSSRWTRPRTPVCSATGARALRHGRLPVDGRRSAQRQPAGRLRALHPRRRRLHRCPRCRRYGVRVELVRQPRRRLLPQPPARAPTATVDVEDPTNRSTAHLPARWERVDEWYNYRSPDFADPNVPDGDYSPREGAYTF